ncbi:unnamed protein product [Sphenostylis stenocarpa]|uniref:Uncharacterized protein n=1 Tax=Sphenostylis stenocarpa TaxID=92480 RepID=A0AA86TGF7_9FABA|nr:unnamed protein product [Sphenostylis stenocarpa]
MLQRGPRRVGIAALPDKVGTTVSRNETAVSPLVSGKTVVSPNETAVLPNGMVVSTLWVEFLIFRVQKFFLFEYGAY